MLTRWFGRKPTVVVTQIITQYVPEPYTPPFSVFVPSNIEALLIDRKGFEKKLGIRWPLERGIIRISEVEPLRIRTDWATIVEHTYKTHEFRLDKIESLNGMPIRAIFKEI